mmetsp:Transcript_30504/g.116761  ORF Transcript_30504/g.116761 Transcript_30504/m.116761 type:complete len:109 (-) Transcript_30504:1043-1369(-)
MALQQVHSKNRNPALKDTAACTPIALQHGVRKVVDLAKRLQPARKSQRVTPLPSIQSLSNAKRLCDAGTRSLVHSILSTGPLSLSKYTSGTLRIDFASGPSKLRGHLR